MVQLSRRTALVGLLGLGVAGCSTSLATPLLPPTSTLVPVPTTSPTPRPTPAPVDARPRWPLTGKLLDKAGDARHVAIAVKVPDNRYEHPQVGIDKADIVFVELEGYLDSSGYSGTRLMPVYHSRMAESVAPVRSIRPVDIPLLSPMDALIGNTGAARWVINYVKHYRRHVEGMLSYLATVGTGSYGINRSRVYQLNGQYYYDRAVICHPAVLAKQTKRFKVGPTQPYFPWATAVDKISTEQGKKARSVQIPYKGDDYFMGYDYDSKTKRYLRSMPWGPHVMADGTRISVDNVLIIKAKQHYGKIFRGGGHEEPLHDIIDKSGDFLYVNQGRYVTGTWKKGKVDDPFTFILADGKPLKMAPGKTFVELPDTKAKLKIKD